VSGEALVGEVEGSVAIIVDDLISGGTTVARAAQACRARGARQVHVAASHGLFAAAAGAILAQAPIDDIVVTDTVSAARITDTGLLRRVTWLGAAPRFAEAIARLHRGGSLVELGEG
ncbi:MAG: phosphoribosyltransferase family protein, partial [Candidatus Levyibacteriota bacterium]